MSTFNKLIVIVLIYNLILNAYASQKREYIELGPYNSNNSLKIITLDEPCQIYDFTLIVLNNDNGVKYSYNYKLIITNIENGKNHKMIKGKIITPCLYNVTKKYKITLYNINERSIDIVYSISKPYVNNNLNSNSNSNSNDIDFIKNMAEIIINKNTINMNKLFNYIGELAQTIRNDRVFIVISMLVFCVLCIVFVNSYTKQELYKAMNDINSNIDTVNYTVTLKSRHLNSRLDEMNINKETEKKLRMAINDINEKMNTVLGDVIIKLCRLNSKLDEMNINKKTENNDEYCHLDNEDQMIDNLIKDLDKIKNKIDKINNKSKSDK